MYVTVFNVKQRKQIGNNRFCLYCSWCCCCFFVVFLCSLHAFLLGTVRIAVPGSKQETPQKTNRKNTEIAHIWLFPNRRKTHIHPASSWSLKTNVNKDIYWCRINSCFYDVASQSLTEKCVNLFIFSSEIQPRKAICTEFLSRDLDRNQTTNKFAAGVKDPR